MYPDFIREQLIISVLLISNAITPIAIYNQEFREFSLYIFFCILRNSLYRCLIVNIAGNYSNNNCTVVDLCKTMTGSFSRPCTIHRTGPVSNLDWTLFVTVFVAV